MNLDEALKVCEDWFAYNERTRQRSVEVQRLAALARTNPEEARKRLREYDRSPTVYDGARLEPAVRFLVERFRDTDSARGSET